MRRSLLKTLKRRRWGRSLDHFNRVIILPSPICSTLIALLLEQFLGLGVCEPQKKLHSIFSDDVVVLVQNVFRNIAGFKSVNEDRGVRDVFGRLNSTPGLLTEQSPLPC